MARDFNGSTDHLRRGTVPVSGLPLTIACIANLDNITAQHYLVSFGDTAGNTNYLALIAKGDVAGDPIRAAYVTGGSPVQADTSTGYSLGTDHHVCAVFESTTSRSVYIDGGSKGTDTTSKDYPSGIDAMAVGRLERSSPAAYTNGRVSHVAIWNVALTDGEVAALAAGASPLTVRAQSLVAFWPIIGNNSPEIDIVGGYDLTVSGATKFAHPRIYQPIAQILQFPPTAAAPAATIPIFVNHYRNQGIM